MPACGLVLEEEPLGHPTQLGRSTALPLEAFGLLVAGGVLYSIGAAIYALKRPNPAPRYFGFHEIFHLFVIAGGVAFVVAIWVWVVPFPRA